MMKVSVSMITYNHENYIAQAIEAVLMQKTNFEVELVISNDNSTDNTHEIIKDVIATNNTNIKIKYFNNLENKGMMPNFIHNLEHCDGNYIALCDGDDYWTDPLKLQKQIDLLESNLNIAICYHQVNSDYNGSITDYTSDKESITSIKDLAKENYIVNCSVVYRNGLINELPNYFISSPIGDYFLHLLNARKGDIFYIKEKMANYRIHDSSYWSTKNSLERAEILNRFITNIKPYFNQEIQDILQIQLEKLPRRKTTFFKKISIFLSRK
ncbi:glycosyltransferase [Flavobacterium oreochromis]|uniref:glycosyltransferase n=1 Tax=Flavobacterium oreochromis TaxID=2906078 RepID=UPI00385BAA0F